MSENSSINLDPPIQVSAAPESVFTRLWQRLLPMGSLWFPTRRELRAWEDAGVPLYVRRIGKSSLEVGPKLASMWAACFAPVLVGQVAPSGKGSTIRWSRRPPWFTIWLLVGWWLVLAAWPVALIRAAETDDPNQWWVFWAFLSLASTLGPAAGYWLGGAALDAAVPWLREALLQPDVEEDW